MSCKCSDQTARMRRLIWDFAGRTYHIVGNLMPRLIYFVHVLSRNYQIWDRSIPYFSFKCVRICVLVYSKTCLKRPLKMKTKTWFSRQILAKCRSKVLQKESILQYFRPSLSYNLSLRPLFCLFLSDHLRQVLLYNKAPIKYGCVRSWIIGIILICANMSNNMKCL